MRGNLELYYNRELDQVLERLTHNDNVVYSVDQNRVIAWYPLAEPIAELEEANARLRSHDFEIVEMQIHDPRALTDDTIQHDTLDTITSTFDQLMDRLERATPRPVDRAMLICEDAPDWKLVYQPLYMG